MQLRPLTPTETDRIEQTRSAYRAMWTALRHVPERNFDGGRDDLDALSFIDYEAGHHPEGAFGAAIIFGGVLVKTGVFAWAMADETWLALVTTQEYPRVTILPHARLAEIEGSSWPATANAQRFDWMLEEIVVRLCAGGIDGVHLRPLLELIDRDETLYWDVAKEALDVLKAGGVPGAR
jgi:hypothetical protein